MSDVKYTEDHEWIRMGADGVGTVGITDHAQEQLGELVFVELPEVGKALSKGDDAVVIDDWTWHPPRTHEYDFRVDESRQIRIRVEHFELDGYAVLSLDLEPVE